MDLPEPGTTAGRALAGRERVPGRASAREIAVYGAIAPYPVRRPRRPAAAFNREEDEMSTPLLVPKDIANAITVHLVNEDFAAQVVPETATQAMIRVGAGYVVVEDEREAKGRQIVAGIMTKAKGGDLEAVKWLEDRGVVKLPPKDPGSAE